MARVFSQCHLDFETQLILPTDIINHEIMNHVGSMWWEEWHQKITICNQEYHDLWIAYDPFYDPVYDPEYSKISVKVETTIMELFNHQPRFAMQGRLVICNTASLIRHIETADEDGQGCIGWFKEQPVLKLVEFGWVPSNEHIRECFPWELDIHNIRGVSLTEKLPLNY